MNFKKLLLPFFTLFLLILASCDLGVQDSNKRFTVTFYEFDTQVLSFTVKENCYISSSVDYPQLRDYKSTAYADFILNGWYTADGVDSSNLVITADTSFYASFSATVNFYSYNHSAISTTKHFTVGKTLASTDYPSPLSTYTENSVKHSFLYWSENKAATPETRQKDEFKNTITKDKGTINLYPIYSVPKVYTVKFYTDPNGSPTTKNYQENSTISESSLYYDSILYSDLLYWSESRANKTEAEAKKVTKVTKDLTLYGIYSPAIYNITEIENGSITLKIGASSKVPYTFADGTIPGLTISYNTSTSDSIDLTTTSFNMQKDPTSNYYFAKYTFAPLPSNTYTFTVKTPHEPKTESYVDFADPAPVTNLSATTKDSYAKITWTKATGYSKYTVKAMNGTTVEQTKSNCSTSAEFYGLKNDIQYTFVVQTGTSNETNSVTATPQVEVTNADWVVAMYMDGDNNLNDPIYIDMNEVEYGLYSNTNYASATDEIKVVALWDGYNKTTGDDVPQLKHAASCIYELGTDTSCNTTYITSSGAVLSGNTKNLSYTAADWLTSTQPSEITQNFTGEVNMGSEQTLENFLKWVKARYTASKGYILQFSDHGGGPRSVRYLKTDDGHIIKLNDESRRALCWDESSSNNFLSTKDVATALKNAGYGESNKIDMILMDVCLGASIEDAYEFSPYAKYLAASPNTIPGTGMDYTDFIKSFSSSKTIEEIGKQLIKDYIKQYHTAAKWVNYLNNWYGKSYVSISSYSQDEIDSASNFSQLGIPTLSFIDLSEISELSDSINTLAGLLEGDSIHKMYYKTNTDGKKEISTTETEDYKDFSKGLGELYLNYPGTLFYSMFYLGTYSWLTDIGALFQSIKGYTAPTLKDGSANIYSWPEVYGACDNVLSKCNDAILYSWRDYYHKTYTTTSYSNFYNKGELDNTYENYVYGLTICGANIATQGDSLVPGSYPDFYGNLNFGKENGVESNWYKLLKKMFGN